MNIGDEITYGELPIMAIFHGLYESGNAASRCIKTRDIQTTDDYGKPAIITSIDGEYGCEYTSDHTDDKVIFDGMIDLTQGL